ncbi:glutamine-hydrolyzing GMP synthase [Candidatus Halobeggiatoa sp. HSG11]|nr:glutamine-hydrolyzing GMP synthase [Candidatus Halobeggiatoa sp. HSG11]
MPNIHSSRILILDFGSQYTQLIARRVRESQVYCEIYPYDVPEQEIKKFQPQGIILSGSPESVNNLELQAPTCIFTLNIPILGICYGMHTMALQLGGQVTSSEQREFGYAQVKVQNHCQLLQDVKDQINSADEVLLDVWMSHGDKISKLPTGFKIIAATENTPIAAMADEERHFYGLQFHPEVTHTSQGSVILQRFVHDICGCEKLWTATNIIEDSITQMQAKVGDGKVLLALSGGVDSSVVAALLHRAIGKQLVCVFVDNGLLRLNEAEQVMATFEQHLGVQVIHVQAEIRFLEALQGVSDPEQKRKIIGNLFIKIFEEEANKLSSEVQFLAQGTIYPDVIESAASKFGKAHVIKSHHNVGGLPDTMKLKLVEPLRELFKDEVRKIGVELGLPAEMVYRHPFPGPGLGVRILGEVKKNYADILRQADAIFIEELRKQDWYDKVSQAFTVFLPVKSVGVMGDARHYDYVVALRAVETIDFMTARWAHLPYSLLETVSNRIINEVTGISRVSYDISSKPPATIEWE